MVDTRFKTVIAVSGWIDKTVAEGYGLAMADKLSESNLPPNMTVSYEVEEYLVDDNEDDNG